MSTKKTKQEHVRLKCMNVYMELMKLFLNNILNSMVKVYLFTTNTKATSYTRLLDKSKLKKISATETIKSFINHSEDLQINLL